LGWRIADGEIKETLVLQSRNALRQFGKCHGIPRWMDRSCSATWQIADAVIFDRTPSRSQKGAASGKNPLGVFHAPNKSPSRTQRSVPKHCSR
jgi:hypothetical protein